MVNNAGRGIATVATLSSSPALVERYFSLWLDMSTPSGVKNGYELRLTETASNTYTVTLSKWLSGAQTVLASRTNFVFEAGKAFALVDKGTTVSAWFKTGIQFTSLFSATDSSFTSGKSGIEGSGNNIRLTNFKTGVL